MHWAGKPSHLIRVSNATLLVYETAGETTTPWLRIIGHCASCAAERSVTVNVTDPDVEQQMNAVAAAMGSHARLCLDTRQRRN